VDQFCTGYLAELQASVVSLANAPDYAKLIHDLHLRRELIAAGHEIAAMGFTVDIDKPAADQAEDAHQRLTGLIDASALPTEGPRPIGDAVEAALDELTVVHKADGAVIGAPTGLSDLDHLLGGLQAPAFVLIAARPSMGKTALALNIARHVAREGGRVAFYSLEMSETQLIQRLTASETGIPLERHRAGPLDRADYLTLVEATQNLRALPLLLDDGQSRSVAAMRAHARRAKRRGGVALVVVDYLQLMVSGSPQYRAQEVSDISRGLKMMAKDLGVPVLALSQLSREVEKRPDKRPQLSDLRDSGSLEQDADQVVFIYRAEYYLRMAGGSKDTDAYMQELQAAAGLAEIIVGKNRHGCTGTVQARWNGVRQQFSDWEDTQAQQEAMW
jgi:replicative DNA helicase